ncbi:hypothetical protein BGP_3552 [Beggiatoa sp. PS]|nr:hypothetical protein BGP_3552 [Beggiatoa sp. PS]
MLFLEKICIEKLYYNSIMSQKQSFALDSSQVLGVQSFSFGLLSGYFSETQNLLRVQVYGVHVLDSKKTKLRFGLQFGALEFKAKL